MRGNLFEIAGGVLGAAAGAGVGYVIEQPPPGDVLTEISKGIMVLGFILAGGFIGYEGASIHRLSSRINREVKKRSSRRIKQ